MRLGFAGPAPGGVVWLGRTFANASLFYRLLAALLLVGLVTAVPIFFLSFKFNQDAAGARAEKELGQQVGMLAASFDQEYRMAVQRSLKQIAASDALVNLLTGPREERIINAKTVEALFLSTAREHASYSGLFFLDSDGREVATVVDQQRQASLSPAAPWVASSAPAAAPSPTVRAGRRLFDRLSTTPALLAAGNMEWFMPPRSIVFEGPFQDERGRPSLLAGLATLDVDSGAFSGAVILRLNLQAFAELLRSVRMFDENLLWLHASDGQLMQGPGSQSFDPAGLLPRDFSNETRVLRTDAGLVAYRDLGPAADQALLRLSYAVPYALIARDFAATRNVFLITMLVSGVVVFALAYGVSRTISRPIVRLAEVARRLAQGELDVRAHVPSGGEIKVLVDSFNSMAESLENSVRYLSTQTTVIEKAPFGILIIDPVDPLKPIRYVNESFNLLMRFPAGQVLGQHPRFLFSDQADERAATAVEAALEANRAAEVEILNRDHDGADHLMRWLLFPCYSSSGQLLSSVIFLTDITEIRAAQIESQRLASELQESNKLQFLSLTIAGMAHDLNTPIGVAVTAASHLQRTVDRAQALVADADGSANVEALRTAMGKVRHSAEIIGRNLEKAGQLVQGFKKTSANATRTEWTSVDLLSLLESLLMTLSPILQRAHCTVDLDCRPGLKLFTEPGSISQALTNLILNATLHAFEGRENRRIALKVWEEGEQVMLSVEDNGTGMSEEAAVKAFTPFFTTKRSSGGSGLGLFSCRRVIEDVLGGRIDFKSVLGQGTRFQIQLPRNATARAVIKEEPSHV